MTIEIAFVFLVTLGALVLFVKEWLPPDGVGLLALLVLVAGGILEPREAFHAFGNEALVTVAAMFVLSAGLTRTGAVDFLGRRIVAWGGRSEPRVLLALMLTVAFCSSCINNTPVAVVFLPIVLGIAETTGIRGSKLLIPMSYATIVGGMCTVIGTSTNVLISGELEKRGLPAVSMFAPLPLALAGIALTVLYMVTVGRRLLPSHATVTSSVRAGKIRDYLTEIHVPADGGLVGRSVSEAILARAPGVRVLQVIRGEEVIPASGGREILRAGDVLLVKGEVNALLALQRSPGLDVAPDLAPSDLRARVRDTTLAELLVRPGSGAIGSTVRSLGLNARYGVVVLAVQRHGTHTREMVADIVLRFADVLLVQADAEALARLRDSEDLVVLEDVEERVIHGHRAWIALTTVGLVVALAALNVWPISALALAACLVLAGTRCVSVREAYRAVDLPTLVLMAGTIGLGTAMQSSGAARWVAEGIVRAAAPLGDVALLGAIYLVCNVLTAAVSNAAAALIVLPIALATATAAGLRTEPFVMAVMFAASIDFSTPIGYQTNTFVYGPGGYRFMDYVRVGAPLNLLWWILATALIPVLWPLR